MPAYPDQAEEPPEPEPTDPEEIYSPTEEQLVAQRLEALGYLE